MFIANVNVKYIFFGLVFVFLSIVLLVSCLSINNNAEAILKYDDYLKDPPDIRVLLEKNVKEKVIEIDRPYNILDLDSNVMLAGGTNLSKSVIYLESGEFKVRPLSSELAYKDTAVFVKANGKVGIVTNNGFVKLDESKYRGKLILVPLDNDRFSVLEEINIEEYLPGVVESEMPAKWQDDAIQAQVIAARTFAIYQRKTKGNALYHIDKLDLAYSGSYKYQPKIKELVNKSRGTVMLYKWELFPGYFHSTCGGHTEDINLVFNLKSIPPLSGVDCGYCNKSKYYRWRKILSKDEIAGKLNTVQSGINNIRNIYAENVGPGGHCSTIKIEYSGGTKRVNANEFRLKVGPSQLRSTAFHIKDNGSSLVFDGNGWGHGVGLCQYGTQDMAKSGFKWFDILKHYYPGIDLVKIY